MKDKDFLQLEYEVLYNEIESNSQICANLFTISMTATATLIGFGIDNGVWSMFLAPFALLIPSLYFMASQMESTIKNAAYIAEVIEPNIDSISWETDWFELRRKRLDPTGAMTKYTVSISVLYGLVSIVCLILSWFFFLSVPTIKLRDVIILTIISVVITILMTHAITTIRHFQNPALFEGYRKAWRKVKEEQTLLTKRIQGEE